MLILYQIIGQKAEEKYPSFPQKSISSLKIEFLDRIHCFLEATSEVCLNDLLTKSSEKSELDKTTAFGLLKRFTYFCLQ